MHAYVSVRVCLFCYPEPGRVSAGLGAEVAGS